VPDLDDDTSVPAWGGAEVVRDLAVRATLPTRLDPQDLPWLLSAVLPDDHQLAVVDLEQYAAAPRAKRAAVRLDDPESFVAYVHAHHTDATTLWATVATGQIVAVLDDHHPGPDGTPGWAAHRATLTLQQTPEWQLWTKADGSMVSQVQFAELIENGLASIREPTAADMLEIAQTFHGTRNITFRHGVRLTSGQVQLQYDEDTQTSAGRTGHLEVPEVFVLGLAPWYGTPAYRVEARLRWRLGAQGALSIGYKLIRPDEVLRAAFADIQTTIGEQTGMRPYTGVRGGTALA
jgi:uncharacterized protein YfdQ (DUF2303 family)